MLAGMLALTAAVAAGCGSAAAPTTPAPSAAPTAPPSAAAKHQGRQHGIRGTVTAEDGSTWTVTTAAQRAFTVTVTPQTAFGTRKAPGTAQQFPVGAPVRVVGAVNGAAITAERIITPRAAGQQTPATAVPSTAPTG